MSEAAQRQAWKSFDGNEGEMVEIAFGPDRLRVARPTVDAWHALDAVLAAHGYDIRPDDTHGYFPRNVKGTNTRSLHAFGLALDVNATTNPMRETPNRRKVRFSDKPTQKERAQEVTLDIADTDMTPAMVAAACAIRTRSGKQAFGWGGHWNTRKDTMHFYVDVPPADMASGIDASTVPGTGAPLGAGTSVTQEDILQWVIDNLGTKRSTEGQPMSTFPDVARFKPLLDFIAMHEGTAKQPGGGYNTSLAFGKFTGGEQDLVNMTLDEINVLQQQMLHNPANNFNSSALGRYQIVRKTLLGLRAKLGLSGTDKYSPQLQDRLGVELIKGRGRNAAALGQEWASLAHVSPALILAAYDKIGTDDTGGTMAQNIGADVGVSSDTLAKLIQTLLSGQAAAMITPPPATMTQDNVRYLQQQLASLNYHPGGIDGIFGALTRGAVAAFQADNGIPGTGIADAVTMAALNTASPRALSPQRLATTADDLRAAGSVEVKNADRARYSGWIMGLLGALGLTRSVMTGTVAPAANTAVQATVTTPADVTPQAIAQLLSSLQAKVPALSGVPGLDNVLAILKGAPVEAVKPAVQATASGLIDTLLPTVLNAVLPGAGGSALAVALGIAAHVFGTNVINRRVETQRNGTQVGVIGS